MNKTQSQLNYSSEEANQLDRAFLGHPKPLSSLFFTEMWERFSYYSIRPLLVLFMSSAVASGGFGFDSDTASNIYGIFAGCIYIAALPGGWLADNWLGQERSVWWGAVVIALGHLAIGISFYLGQTSFFVGLIFIVLGSGIFKTCVSVIVGSLYNDNDARRNGGYTLFYMGINLGSFIAAMIVGYFRDINAWHLGFTTGGIGMLVALLVFRFVARKQLYRFAEVRQSTIDWNKPKKQVKNVGNVLIALGLVLIALVALISYGIIPFNPIKIAAVMTYVISSCAICYFLYLFAFSKLNNSEKLRVMACAILICGAAVFWSAFEQKPTSFNLFADKFTDLNIFGWHMPSVWYQSLNPLLIIILAPIFAILWAILSKLNLEPNNIIKFAFALALAGFGFALMIYAAQNAIDDANNLASPLWLFFSITFLTFGELALSPIGMASITLLSPKQIRGQMMGLWFISLALGNLVAGILGGSVSADTLHTLPELFKNMSTTLFIGAAVLVLISFPIKKILSKENIVI